jgi:hypothetical protein
MSAHDDLITAKLELDLENRPWLSYVGLVALRASSLCPPGKIFLAKLHPLMNFTNDLGPAVLVNPENLPHLFEQTGAKTDAELAAILWWCAQQRKKST